MFMHAYFGQLRRCSCSSSHRSEIPLVLTTKVTDLRSLLLRPWSRAPWAPPNPALMKTIKGDPFFKFYLTTKNAATIFSANLR